MSAYNASHPQCRGLVYWMPDGMTNIVNNDQRVCDPSTVVRRSPITTPGGVIDGCYAVSSAPRLSWGDSNRLEHFVYGCTVCYWAITTSTNSMDVGFNSIGSAQLTLNVDGSNRRLYVWRNGGAVFTANPIFSNNQPIHAAFTYDPTLSSNACRIYLNGWYNTAGHSGTINFSASGIRFRVGAFGAMVPGYTVADVRAYNRCLSASEIADIYRDPLAPLRFPRRFVGASAAAPAGNRRRRLIMCGSR